MYHPKMRGYRYQIVEMFPIEDGNGIRELHCYDNLEDAEKVMAVLESVNYDFTCYALMMNPVWDNERERVVARQMRRAEFEGGWDANGSPTMDNDPGDDKASTFY
jgi:hypothetical protein